MKTIKDIIESLLEAAKQSEEGLDTKVTMMWNGFGRDVATCDIKETFSGTVVVLE
jgi:hypothetical protein